MTVQQAGTEGTEGKLGNLCMLERKRLTAGHFLCHYQPNRAVFVQVMHVLFDIRASEP